MTSRAFLGGLLSIGLVVGGLAAQAEVKQLWSFDDEAEGSVAPGFRVEAGEWKVVPDGEDNKVLAQTAESPDDVFNLVLAPKVSARDLDLVVEMKAIAGQLDQGGGLVWRARDRNNYYIARYNPLEHNFRVDAVKDGKRTQLQGADIPRESGWHDLRVVMKGDHIECYFDGKKHLDVHDTTFPGPGMIGLWSKADARTSFDNLILEGR